MPDGNGQIQPGYIELRRAGDQDLPGILECGLRVHDLDIIGYAIRESVL